MTDLRGIARRLRMPADQLRLAADLIQQGYQPGFIERYRADETGRLPRATLWALKLEIDGQMRLEAAKEKVNSQLPKDAELDDEAKEALERATTEVEIDAILRAYRARRNLSQSQERSGSSGALLEKLIAYEGAPIEDMAAWVTSELKLEEGEQACQVIEQTEKLIAALIQCNTGLNEKLRRSIQRKAQIQVKFIEQDKPETHQANSTAKSDETVSEAESPSADAATVQDASLAPASTGVEGSPASTEATPASTEPTEQTESEEAAAVENTAASTSDAPVVESTAESTATDAAPESASTEAPTSEATADGPQETAEADGATSAAEDAASSGDEFSEFSGKKPKAKSKEAPKKSVAKMTPRQRRRRWLISMLQPMKSIKKGVTKLTAYQQLMLGRGRRSQLVETPLSYDKKPIVQMARDAFVADKHPLADWFQSTVEKALESSILTKIENDALSDLEELAQEKLLENATDQLRSNLNQRPVRGHVIMVVDTVGPKAASVAVVGPNGDVLATDEVSCSAQPTTIDQNVVKLGELAHKHRVTLVALTNGPARRYLILTIRELMNQSAASGLRWTMADRGGAEAYAAGRIALRELSAYNRRDRAAIWIGRSLQDPLTQLLKVEQGRLRLGSYQRELPQEPLKLLVRETIADCVCIRGMDVHYANIDALNYVHGVENDQAQQIATLVSQGKLTSRQQLIDEISNWPEKKRRQALGILRVFESEEVLDGTAIHPEDYKLATRLIENTELEAPASAPENWKKPELTLEEPAQTETESPAAESENAEGTVVPEAAEGSDPAEEASSDAAEATTDEAAATEESTNEGVSSEAADGDAAKTDAPADTASVDATATENAEASQEAESPAANASGDSENLADSGDAASESTAETTTTNAATAETATADAATDREGDSKEAETTAALPALNPEYPEDIKPVATKAPPIDVEKLARGWQVGREKVRWLASCLNDPFGDQRLAGSPIPMLTNMPTLATLEPGMCVWAVVVGVADFGAFVEIAPDCSGLIHISRLSSEYVEDPHQVVQVGDLIMTWVVSVDEKKNRVALTALSPAQIAENQQARREERNAGRGNENRGRGGGNRDGGRRESGEGFRGKGAKGGQGGGRGDNRGNRKGPPGKGGRHRDGGGGRGRGPGKKGPSRPVIVNSKKPVAPISSAMKEGDEPLRSFSDLMQFYEAKRTDVPAPKSNDGANEQATEKVAAEAPPAAESENVESAAITTDQAATPVADQPSPPEATDSTQGSSDSGSDEQVAKEE